MNERHEPETPTQSFSAFTPQHNPWFHDSGEYIGPAEFRVEGGSVIQGQGHITWDATGECQIVVDVSPTSAGVAAQHALSDKRLTQFRLTAPDGVFEAARVVVARTQMRMGASFGIQLELRSLAGEFTPTGSGQAKYWTAPLVNFVSDVRSRSVQTDNHPLRIFPTPMVTTELPEPRRFQAVLAANSKNHLIPFVFEREVAFIELLPDYKERVAMLTNGSLQRVATSIVVGSLGSHSYSTQEEVRAWFPFDLFFALSLASGAHVTWGFLEVRDEVAQLVKRFHMSPVKERYGRGFTTILEAIDSSPSGSPTGDLVSAVLRIADPDKLRVVRIVIDHIIRAGLLIQGLENSFDHVVRALEALTEAQGVSSQDLLDGVPNAEQQSVKGHLKTAKAAILGIAESLRISGDIPSAGRVSRIASRAESADQKDLNFGLAVSTLLKRYNFPDEGIVNSHYQKQPRPDGRSWVRVLSAYRGGVIHVGYLEMTSSAELLDVYQYIRHLHDLLVRIILTDIAYTGTYQPTVSQWADPKPPNWVTQNTSASHLGYK